MAVVNENIVVRLAQDIDIPKVKQLLEHYHAKNLTGEQWVNEFVTTDMTQQQPNELSSAESGAVIAVDRSCNKVTGLLLGGSWESLSPWPMFKYIASILNEYRYQGKKLDAASSYQYGPICVTEEYRGQGMGGLLLEYQCKMFAPRYPVIVTFVNVLNPRSYMSHTRNQFEDVGFFSFNGSKCHTVTLPTFWASG